MLFTEHFCDWSARFVTSNSVGNNDHLIGCSAIGVARPNIVKVPRFLERAVKKKIHSLWNEMNKTMW